MRARVTFAVLLGLAWMHTPSLPVPVLPRVRTVEFQDLGHMAPITHPELVNAEIAKRSVPRE